MSDRPTRDLGLPFGCVSSGALRQLADAIDRLEDWHRAHAGANQDRPCLRRIEANGDAVVAHISTGPAVGGSWITLELGPHGWRVPGETG